ncbi:MAG: hypothetical protein RLZZ387_445 [Chloroflexota bacterium]|jgi:5-methylcytosine-specific restriction endonuclease McrA
MGRRRRLPRELWQATRVAVWLRDQGRCQGQYCDHLPPWSLDLDHAHIDHVRPLSRGGSNDVTNLRTLCRRCHTLRADHRHQGMVRGALRDGIIPPDWRALVWDDLADDPPGGNDA